MGRTGLSISCGTCQQSWILDVHPSLYLRLDIASRPCPLCGRCGLTCQDLPAEEPGSPATKPNAAPREPAAAR